MLPQALPSALPKRAGTIALLAVLCLALAACILTPGKFTSQLDVRKDGRFSFSYSGEIYMVALSKLADMGREGAGAEFTPQPCFKDGSGEERACSSDEAGQQKREWEEQRTASTDKRKRDAEGMKAMLGGIDPSDPRAAEELAARLRRQAGWRRVDYKGDGLFEVDFAIVGRLDHDFTFPTIERFPMANAFVQLSKRSDGTLRIDAPGFSPVTGGEPFRGMMQAAAMSADKGNGAKLPVIDGKFSVTTDGAVLANNTDEGPKTAPEGQRLDWTINARSPAAPTALIRLGS
jgi:hypothetical protein